MYLDKKQNIFKNMWFNFIVVPAITLIFALIRYFVTDFEVGDKTISTYLTIGIVALVAQFFLYLKKQVKHSSLHYLYIVFSINISLFVGYILEKFVLNEVLYKHNSNGYPNWWQIWFVTPAIVFGIIFLIKTILWLVLNLVYKKRVKKDAYQDNLEKENEVLKKEVILLKNQLENKNKNLKKEFVDLNKQVDKTQRNFEKTIEKESDIEETK